MSLTPDTHTANKHWSEIKESGAITGMKLMLRAYQIGGNWLFKPILLLVILYYFLTNKLARHASFGYLTQLKRLPEASKTLGKQPLWLLSFRHFWQFGCSLLDKLAAWQNSIGYDDVDTHNREIILQLFQQKRGAVFITSHLGNFEICNALKSASFKDMNLLVLVHTKHAEKFNHLLKSCSDDNPVELLQVTEITPATAIRLSEHYEKGGFIAISGDRAPINNPAACIDINFLGQPATVARGPYILANILQAPLISLTCIKKGGRYQLYFDQLSDGAALKRSEREKNIRALSAQYAALLQKYCLQTPLQWFNFYDFWSEPHETKQDRQAHD